MSDTPEINQAADPSLPLDPIAERVRQRLAAAGEAFDRRHRASRPGTKRRRSSASLLLNASAAANNPQQRERACLRSVFRDLGESHRRYRARTGQAGTPALRAAACAFKQEPSLISLIPVAAFLDELGILAW